MSPNKSKPPQCPKCGVIKAVVPIMYGLPDKKLMRMHERGKIHHHGCEISDNMPAWHCKKCGYEWGSLDD